MGLFDSFFIDVVCPICDRFHTMEFQTKALSCGMSEYEIGDEIDDGLIEIERGIIKECLSTCGEHHYVYCDVVIRDKKFAGIKDIRTKRIKES